MKTVSHTLVTALAMAILIVGCGGADVQTLPEEYLGQWNYTGSSGGIGGTGKGDEATGYIVIGDDNTLATYADDGTLLNSKAFTVTFGETIFGPDLQWILNSFSVLSAPGGASLTISENAYDGFSRHYSRSR